MLNNVNGGRAERGIAARPLEQKPSEGSVCSTFLTPAQSSVIGAVDVKLSRSCLIAECCFLPAALRLSRALRRTPALFSPALFSPAVSLFETRVCLHANTCWLSARLPFLQKMGVLFSERGYLWCKGDCWKSGFYSVLFEFFQLPSAISCCCWSTRLRSSVLFRYAYTCPFAFVPPSGAFLVN